MRPEATYEIIWEFTVAAGQRSQFERAYGPCGSWVQLFRRSPHYIETVLLRDVESGGVYLTIDRWKSRQAFESSQELHGSDYALLDGELEEVSGRGRRVGTYAVIEGGREGRAGDDDQN